MQTEIMLAGFGGQGVLFAGQLLAYSAMDEGLEVTWIPSYGPEMRGGTANCTVIISNEEIGSPMVRCPAALVAMNLPSLDKYEATVRPGGVIVVNSSIARRPLQRTDVKGVLVPGNEIAEGLGERRMANMVLLGALMANLPILPVEALEKALQEHLPARHHRLLPLNYKALRRGAEFLVPATAA
jgi:2-oxoglutarate ferredoxin oxidoreductase subunit gamma